MLLKPLMIEQHEGGRRFKKGQLAAQPTAEVDRRRRQVGRAKKPPELSELRVSS